MTFHCPITDQYNVEVMFPFTLQPFPSPNCKCQPKRKQFVPAGSMPKGGSARGGCTTVRRFARSLDGHGHAWPQHVASAKCKQN